MTLKYGRRKLATMTRTELHEAVQELRARVKSLELSARPRKPVARKMKSSVTERLRDHSRDCKELAIRLGGSAFMRDSECLAYIEAMVNMLISKAGAGYELVRDRPEDGSHGGPGPANSQGGIEEAAGGD